MPNYFNNAKTGTFNITHFIIRFIVGVVILGITAALTPGFTISSLWSLIVGAIVLSVLDFVVSKLGLDASPFGRGIAGFILAAVIIYATQYFVAGYSVSVFGAIVGALVYGIIDAVIPGRAM